MELRRELRIEASNFFEDDGSDDDFDAVIGTPSRSSRHVSRPGKSSSATSRSAAKSHATHHMIDDNYLVGSPLRGLGTTPIAERKPKVSKLTKANRSRRYQEDDVVSTPSNSRAPPARSALLSDRLVLPTPSRNARKRGEGNRGTRSNLSTPTRHKHEKRKSEGERLRSPAADTLTGTYRSLAALSEMTTPRRRTVAKENCNPKASVPGGIGGVNNLGGLVSPIRERDARCGKAKTEKVEYDENGRKVFLDDRERATHKHTKAHDDSFYGTFLAHEREVEEVEPSPVRREKPVAKRPVTADLNSKRPLEWETLSHKTRPASAMKLNYVKPTSKPERLHPNKVSTHNRGPSSKKKIIEYDMHGRRTERKMWCAPPSVKGRPAWSSRPSSSAGVSGPETKPKPKPKSKSKSKSKNDSTRPSTSGTGNDGSRRAHVDGTTQQPSTSASRPQFDPGPGGLGVEHRVHVKSLTEKTERKREIEQRPATERTMRRDEEVERVYESHMADISARVKAFREPPRDGRKEVEKRSPSPSPSPERRKNRETSGFVKNRSYDFDDHDETRVDPESAPSVIVETFHEKDPPNVHHADEQALDAFIDVRNDVPKEDNEEPLSSIHACRSKVRTPSSRGRRGVHGGFGNPSRSAAGIPPDVNSVFTSRTDGVRSSHEFRGGYHGFAPSAPVSPVATGSWMGRGLGVSTLETDRDESGDGFDEALARAASLAYAPSPSRYAERFKTPSSTTHRVEYNEQVRMHRQPVGYPPHQVQQQYQQQPQAQQQYYQQQPVYVHQQPGLYGHQSDMHAHHPAYYQQPAYPQYATHAHQVSPGGYDAWYGAGGQSHNTFAHQPYVAAQRPASAAASFQRYSGM